MEFKYYFNPDKSTVYYGQETMSNSTRHLGIEVYDEEGGMKDYLVFYMTIQEAEQFSEKFQKSLDEFKTKYSR